MNRKHIINSYKYTNQPQCQCHFRIVVCLSFLLLLPSFCLAQPFDSSTVAKMASRMDHLLQKTTQPLGFIVIIPHWPEKQCWKDLEGSRWCRHILHLAREDHGYTEGGQHYREQRYRLSNHDTSVFFLQNAEGMAKWPTTEAKIEKLRHAFRPLHNTATV